MNRNKITVQIGIPAYNEEANVGNLRDTAPSMGRLRTINIFGFKISFTNIREFLIIFKAIFLRKEYSFYSQKDEPFVIDCGSHIGLSILFFKKKYPKARMVGFEPNPVTFKILERNVEQNNLIGVELKNAAVTGKDGTVNLIANTKANKIWRRRGSNWSWSDFVEGSKRYDPGIHRKVKVPSLRLSSFINREVDFLKLDIEGSEGKVIEEIKGKLHLIREITMEFHGNSANKSNKLENILTTLRGNAFTYQIEQNGKMVDGQNVNRTNPYWLTIRAKKSESC
ncbi:FkbM family methyltransferase [Patescibacteria group bacterium]|nr:FkbM family methyltransferase [Patescibacteria group bacterium]